MAKGKGNRKPITKEQRQAIGGMWADYHHPQGEDVIACQITHRVDIPASDRNPANLVCILFAQAFEDKAKQLRQLAAEYDKANPVKDSEIASLVAPAPAPTTSEERVA